MGKSSKVAFKEGDVVSIQAIVKTVFKQSDGEERLHLSPLGDPHIDFFAAASGAEMVCPVINPFDQVLIKGDQSRWTVEHIADGKAWVISMWGHRLVDIGSLERAPEREASFLQEVANG